MINLTLLNFRNPSNCILDCKSFWLWAVVVQIRVIFNLAKVKNQEIIPEELWFAILGEGFPEEGGGESLL